MSTQQEPYPGGGEPKGILCPFLSSSRSLEDGEITDVPNLQPSLELQQLGDSKKLESPSPNDATCSIPPFLSPVHVVSSVPSTRETSMTTEDLDRAKSLVLDLLGWGVSPEYLVECGLSAGIIHKIFTDLRLRLPQNLDVSLLSTPPYGAP